MDFTDNDPAEKRVLPRRILVPLVAAALVLPIVICVLMGVVGLLKAMEDVTGALVAGRVALAAGIAWAVDLILLVVVAGINSMGGNEPPDPMA